MNNLWTWVEYAYAVHKDIRSHTVKKMSMGVRTSNLK